MDHGGPGRSREHTMRLVAIYVLGLAIGLVLLGIWQRGRQQAQPGPAGGVAAPGAEAPDVPPGTP